MIAMMAGMEMNENHGPMTQQEIADMQMAQAMQDREVNRAQQRVSRAG